jgi:hypothetical protein
MRKLGIGLALGVLLAGTSSYAQDTRPEPSITSVQTFANSYVSPRSQPVFCIQCDILLVAPSVPIFSSNDVSPSGSQTFPTETFFSPVGNASWTSVATGDATTPTISFESGNSLGAISALQDVTFDGDQITGSFIQMYSESGVDIGVANGGGLSLHSTITPAGFGFYVADVTDDPGCVLTSSCTEVSPLSSIGLHSFGAGLDAGTVFAEVGFDFFVTAFGPCIEFSCSSQTLYNVSGRLSLTAGGDLIDSDLTDAMAKLNEFQLVTPERTGDEIYHSLGYGWLETEFNALLPLLGSTNQIVDYYTDVYSYSSAPCLTGSTGVDAGRTFCLIAYSGFGDPIGAGDVFADALAFGLGDVGVFNHDAEHLIDGLSFSAFTIDAPRISGNTLVVGGTVPEPATWLTMILGFGFLGSVLRRRRAFAHA